MGNPSTVQPPREEIDYLVRSCCTFSPSQVTAGDIRYAFAGVGPFLCPQGEGLVGDPQALRDHSRTARNT